MDKAEEYLKRKYHENYPTNIEYNGFITIDTLYEIMNGFADEQRELLIADLNEDGVLSILDLILLVNLILDR